ncbi:Fas-binding factor 1 [Trichoplax sp. H2]|nr:Fas-binding factor 1 [Trichoplax sp. H2]|eukprot:RDD37917.1 Fas-binding factor 1 [Trichoplax sp. H2]
MERSGNRPRSSAFTTGYGTSSIDPRNEMVESEEEEDVVLSPAEAQRIANELAGMDDMEANLFGNSLKRSSNVVNQQVKPSLKGSPPRKSRHQESSEISPSPPDASSQDFGDFDEDDPLAGLGLSDSDEEDFKRKKQKKITKSTRAKVPPAEKNQPEVPSGKSQAEDKAQHADVEQVKREVVTSSKPKSANKLTKKTADSDDDITFEAGGLLDDMGFSDGESKPRSKPEMKVTVDDDEDLQPASATLDKFIGKSKPDDAKPGRKLTALDKLLKKVEDTSNDHEEEDNLAFGDYVPSAGRNSVRPSTASSTQKSVRFSDELDRPKSSPAGRDRKARLNSSKQSSIQFDNEETESQKSNDPFEATESSGEDWLSLEDKRISQVRKTPANLPKSQPPNASVKKTKENKSQKSDDWLGLDDHNNGPAPVPKKGAEGDRRSAPKSSPRTDKSKKQSAANWLGLDDDSIPIQESTNTDTSRSPPKSPTRRGSASDWLGFTDTNEDNFQETATERLHSPPKSPSRKAGSEFSKSQDDVTENSAQTDEIKPPQSRRKNRFQDNERKSAEAIFGGDDDDDIFKLGKKDINKLQQRPVKNQHSSSEAKERKQPDTSDPPPSRLQSEGGNKEMKHSSRQTSDDVTHDVDDTFENDGEFRANLSTSRSSTSKEFVSPPTAIGNRTDRAITERNQTKSFNKSEQHTVSKPVEYRDPRIIASPFTEQLVPAGHYVTEDEWKTLYNKYLEAERERQKIYLESIAKQGEYESKMKRYEVECKQLRDTMAASEQRHLDEMEALERTYENRIKNLEENYQRRENRLKDDLSSQTTQFVDKIRLVETEKSDLMVSHGRKIANVEAAKVTEIEEIRRTYRATMDEVRQQFNQEKDQWQAARTEEISALMETYSQTQALNDLVHHVKTTASSVNSLQGKMKQQQQYTLTEREQSAKEKDEELKRLQEKLIEQHTEIDRERLNLQTLIAKMETHYKEQVRQVQEEKWNISQEAMRLKAKIEAYEEDHRQTSERIAKERIDVEKAKDALNKEQKEILAQCYEERRLLAAERAELLRNQNLSSYRQQTEQNKALKTEADMEVSIVELAKKKAEVEAERAGLQREREQLMKEQNAVELNKQNVEKLKNNITKMEIDISKRAQEVEHLSKIAIQMRHESEKALHEALMMQSELEQRANTIEVWQQNAEAQERQLAQERYAIAQEWRSIDNLKHELRSRDHEATMHIIHDSYSQRKNSSLVTQTSDNKKTNRQFPVINMRPKLNSVKQSAKILSNVFRQDEEELEDERNFLNTIMDSNLNVHL